LQYFQTGILLGMETRSSMESAKRDWENPFENRILFWIERISWRGSRNAKFLISLHLQFSMKCFALLIYRIVIGGAKPIDQLQSNISVTYQFNSYIQNQSQKSRPNIFTQKKHVYLIYMTTYSPKITSQSHQFFILRHFLKHFECSLSQSNESFQNKKLEQKTNQ
jgi:hypothetical protein